MAFEGYSLYPPLTVRENIAFALKAARLPQREVDSKVASIAKLLEIEDILGPLSKLDLRRPAAARQPRPRADPRGRPASARRADGPARTAASRRAARPHQALHQGARADDDPRHPRPDRGQRAGRPHRGHGRRRAAAIRYAAEDQGAAGQPVHRHLRRRAADECLRGRGRHQRERRSPLASDDGVRLDYAASAFAPGVRDSC